MSPDEFDQRQRQLEANVAAQTELLRGIRQDIRTLGWCIALVALIALGLAA